MAVAGGDDTTTLPRNKTDQRTFVLELKRGASLPTVTKGDNSRYYVVYTNDRNVVMKESDGQSSFSVAAMERFGFVSNGQVLRTETNVL